MDTSVLNILYPLEEIYRKREVVGKELLELSETMKIAQFEVITVRDLEILFDLYDQEFLGSWFSKNFQGKMKFSLSKRMTRSAGMTLYPKNGIKMHPEKVTIEIRMSVDFFINERLLGKTSKVGGIETHHSLEVLQLVFEHELIHAMEFALYHHSSCKGKRFKAIAYQLFGHTQSFHALPTHQQIAKEIHGFTLGMKVRFMYQEQYLEGLLWGIHKNAIVLVADRKGCYQDKKGNRYAKYYVPLNKLER